MKFLLFLFEVYESIRNYFILPPQTQFVMSDGGDLDRIDILSFSAEDLQDRFNNAKDKASVIDDFLRRWDVDPTLATLKKMKIEFEKDLDWFNVEQPLTMDGLRGKVVILDFFTYCCINCMHILPELHSLEEIYPQESGLVVVGVHSPKFENEKDATNILAATQRYGITHPIVNDPRSTLWRSIGIRCWPSLLVLSPSGAPLLLLMGEGHSKFLECFIKQALSYFDQKGTIANFVLPLRPSTDSLPASNLRFPAKIARSEDGRFAVADASNNRILIMDRTGLIQQKIGGPEAGFIDEDLIKARFNSPQGVAFLTTDVLIVADTANHALRQITLSANRVETLVGTGRQGSDRIGGNLGPLQPISSPWDVDIYRTRDMDMSFHLDEQNVPEKTIILVSMAGSHQIWGYFPDGIILWKFRKFDPRTSASLIGNGLEENRNNSYPQNAAFAQPSGIVMAKNFLFIADSESSSVRKASMLDGKVTAVVGGDRNPLNLFAFGDVDGKQYNAKLQHPLGITYNHVTDKIYVADTYNHKIKVIDAATNIIETLLIKNENGDLYKFNEPAGLCFDANCEFLLVSDTNNHNIQIVDMQTLTTRRLKLDFSKTMQLSETDAKSTLSGSSQLIKKLPLANSKRLLLNFNLSLEDGLKYTTDAPQKWNVSTTNTSFHASILSGFVSDDSTFNVHLEQHDKILIQAPENIKLDIALNLCDAKCCLMKRFSLTLCNDEIANDAVLESVVEQNIEIHIGQKEVSVI